MRVAIVQRLSGGVVRPPQSQDRTGACSTQRLKAVSETRMKANSDLERAFVHQQWDCHTKRVRVGCTASLAAFLQSASGGI